MRLRPVQFLVLLLLATPAGPLALRQAAAQPTSQPQPASQLETPPLHRITMIPTRHVPGGSGVLILTLARSPFDLPVTTDGRLVFDVRVALEGFRPEAASSYVVWVATADLEAHRRLGTLDTDLSASGRTDWNQFVVFVTAEASSTVEDWSGPVLFSASSPSGWLKPMIGEALFGNNELPIQSRYCLVNEC